MINIFIIIKNSKLKTYQKIAILSPVEFIEILKTSFSQ